MGKAPNIDTLRMFFETYDR